MPDAPDRPPQARAPRPAPSTERLLRVLVLLAWAILIFTFLKHVVYYQFLRPTAWGTDFDKHYWAAKEVLAGRSPFLGTDGGLLLAFNYPQLTAWLYLWLAPFSLPVAEKLWNVVNALYVVAAFAMLVAWFRPRALPVPAPGRIPPAAANWAARNWPAVAAFAYAVFAPVFMEIHCGNIEPLNLILLVALAAALRRGRDGAAGVLLTVVCLVKIVPVLFVLPFVMARKWKLLGVFAATSGAYAALLFASELWRPGEGWWRYELFLVTDVLPHLAFEYMDISRSYPSMLARNFAPALMESKPLYDLLTRIASGAVALCWLAVLPAGFRRAKAWLREAFVFTSLTLVLISPLIEYHHLVWAIPAYIFLILDWIEGRVSNRFFLAGMSLWAFIFFARVWMDLGGGPPLHPLDLAFLAATALWAMLGWDLLRRARAARRADA